MTLTKQDPLIRHAITPPAFDSGKLHRERLVDAIHANIPKKLIVVAAAAGYGKTTLLSDFTEHTDLPSCWYRITEADLDLARFARGLFTSLQQRFRRLKGHFSVEAVAQSTPEAIGLALCRLIDEHITESFVIILDDIQVINHSSDALRFLDQFLSNQPEQVTLVCAGREVPEVSLAQLMANGNLVGFGPDDLALNRDELRELVTEKVGEQPDDELLDQLITETRGWITGVLLSTTIARGDLNNFIGESNPLVFDYLASVVLNRQPDDIRRFALDSSVLPVMTAEACNEILEIDDSQRLLTRMVRQGLFIIAADRTPRTYEYHPQFRQFLLESLQASDERRLQRLRVRAAEYLHESGATEFAIDLLLEAGSDRRAGKLADEHADSMFRKGSLHTLQRWAEEFKEREISAPNVNLYIGIAYADAGDLEAAEHFLARARDMIHSRSSLEIRARASNLEGLITAYRGDFDKVASAIREVGELLSRRHDPTNKAMWYRMQAWKAENQRNYQEAEGYAERAVEELKHLDQDYYRAAALVDLSNIQAALGKSRESYTTSVQALEVFQQVGAALPLAIAHNNVAVSAHERGQYLDALRYFREGLKYARLSASPRREANILLGQADVFNDIDLSLQAAELYGQALTIATRHNYRDLIMYGCLRTCVLHRRHGSNAIANEWLKRAVDRDDGVDLSPEIQIQKAALEVELAPEKALDTLKQVLGAGEKDLEAAEKTLASFYSAMSAYRLKEEDLAQERMSEALRLASLNEGEQAIAGELMYEPGFWNFIRTRMGDHPILEVIDYRIQTMRTVARQYEPPTSAEDAAVAPIEVEAMGISRIRIQGEEIESLKPLQREILFYLVDQKRVRRDELVETFWPDQTPGRQVSSLHTAVYGIRRVLGKESVVFDGSVYRLSEELAINYDVPRFERAAEIAEALPPGDPRRMFALTEAVHSYSGPFLSDMASEWVIQRRRLLELRYLDLLASYSEEALVRSQPQKAVQVLRDALRVDPYRDDLNLHYLEALGQLGRRSEIVSHYRQYVDLLSHELGIDPPQEVRELYARLLG